MRFGLLGKESRTKQKNSVKWHKKRKFSAENSNFS